MFHAYGFIAVSITNAFFNEKKIEKPMPSTGETDAGTFFKAWLQWQVLSHLRKAGEGGAGSLLSARLTFPPWKEW